MTPSSSDSDNHFHDALGDMTPIEQDTHFLQAPKKKPLLNYQRPNHPEKWHRDDPLWVSSTASYRPEDSMAFIAPQGNKKLQKALQQGKFIPHASLDLHGKNCEQAHYLLSDFFESALQRSWPCMKIIHGKGGSDAILKNFCYDFCKSHPQTVALSSCPANRGGTGAMYVLINTTKVED